MAKHKNRNKQGSQHDRSSAAERGSQDAQSSSFESENQSSQSTPQGSPADVARKHQRRFGHN
ncbi:hypothetical protein OG204_08550 [Streptomyces sp. NBC_01387]|uniref:hypothetical protein n=1 Tax=unclassified Streptomyces TaxID=2593676 RepID=UPI0020249380|nr:MULTISPECIES: hypothetical protein [unclassified Streptomyces]MCX4551665.1 hypothetical protein [Streptomyces sp. NBC_01500]WSC23045.1 hypothetical protein OIE60_27070 [Streptomyces sp. NBC_01766]WSV56956.1 hypothetical protein OG282_26495 [Streptomyces sp. NBC_01014]